MTCYKGIYSLTGFSKCLSEIYTKYSANCIHNSDFPDAIVCYEKLHSFSFQLCYYVWFIETSGQIALWHLLSIARYHRVIWEQMGFDSPISGVCWHRLLGDLRFRSVLIWIKAKNSVKKLAPNSRRESPLLSWELEESIRTLKRSDSKI